ncbi:MAG: glycosyltransferase family 4 protein [Spiribacter salinus]|uniref:Glycosyltransferase family 4 protein n=1 Tax=Spiribacter salinus TaxID=1335746 RepID=A0A540VNG3_9GAMM|nr:MAG: glycosyltransferase family 4 protein [Spiribacter salinus]
MATHRPRRVLFINRVYPPAGGATGALLAELAEDLSAGGWEVHILTGPHPGAPEVDRQAGVWVHRVDGLAFTRESTWRRAAAYLSLYPRFLTHALRLPRPDVIVTKTDPPMLKVLGPALGALTGARTVHWAQDLYPEVAEALQVIPERGVLANAMRSLSTWALNGHDHIVAVGRCMKRRIEARGIAPEKISVVPNWAPSTVHPVPHEQNTFRTKKGWQGKTVVMYSGNMGLAHPFEVILNAAEQLRYERPDMVFAFVGEGARKAWIAEQAATRNLSNITLLPFQPKDRLAESLSAADVHLVTMQSEVEGLVVPSKVYGVLAAGRPCVFLGPEGSEAAQQIHELNAGTVLQTPTPASVVQALKQESGSHPHGRDHKAYISAQEGRTTAVTAFNRLLDQIGNPASKATTATPGYR